MLETLDSIKESLFAIAKFLDYVFHPSKILWLLWNWTLGMSYWICLFIALFAIISYILGVKKYAKYVPFSIGIYALLQAIGSVI